MADKAIDHDGVSTVATVGYKAAKWGIIGAIAAFALPMVAGFAAAAVASAILPAAIGSIAATLIGGAGIVAGLFTGVTYGGAAAAGGGLIGAIKGGGQVNRENHAYAQRGHSKSMTKAREMNDRDIHNIQQGYGMAMHDLEPVVHQREAAAFARGQEALASQIQEQINAQSTSAGAQTKTGKFADKQLSLKCESKAEAILKERDLKEMAPKQLGA
jgi:hypothetical protein